VPADLKKALAFNPQALAAWRTLHRWHATSGYVGLNQLEKQKREAAGSRGAVQALRMENDAHVVGPDAPIANSKMVKPDLRPWTGTGQLLACPQFRGDFGTNSKFNSKLSPCSRQRRRAASIVAISILFIVIIDSKARFASPPPAASASVSARGVI